jgi:hypothetical protein
MADERTDEIKAADAAIEKAISDRMTLNPDYDGDFLDDWTLVYSAVHPEKDFAWYGTMHRDSNLPSHRVLGLLKIAYEYVLPDIGKEDND